MDWNSITSAFFLTFQHDGLVIGILVNCGKKWDDQGLCAFSLIYEDRNGALKKVAYGK